MGQIKNPAGVKLFAGVMYRRDFDPRPAIDALTSAYGGIEISYGPIEFSWSDYYRDEMGEGLLKYYALFEAPIDRALLPSVKIHTNGIEERFAGGGGRRAVNIDPGYLTADKLVLASTKDFFHRLYLGDGIFGEATLHYRKSGRRSGGYRFFSWTYPDYREPAFMEFLEACRDRLPASPQHPRPDA